MIIPYEKKNYSHKLKAGVYYIIDPCYLLGHSEEEMDQWGDFVDELYGDSLSQVDYRTENAWIENAKYGDGVYSLTGNNGIDSTIWVDAGLIGILREDWVREFTGNNLALLQKTVDENAAAMLSFSEDFEVKYDDGIFYIGQYVIDTKGELEEEGDLKH